MTSFAKYDDNGTVIATGHLPEEMIALQDGNIYIGEADVKKHYIVDGILQTYTPAEQLAKSELNQGWIWKMPERIAVDMRTTEKKKDDVLQAVLRARKAAYPSVEDQLDALWCAMDTGILPKVPDFYDPIKAAKLAHPKPVK